MSTLVNTKVVDMDPVPFEWMVQKGNQLYMEARSYARDEEDLISRFNGHTCMNGAPVNNKGSLIQFFAEKAAQDLITNLVLRSWGKKKGVPGDHKLENMANYVVDVKAELDRVAIVEEVDINTLK
jgi:hypothetical protein